ncbi:hypothetical protein Scel_03920 [Streptomyces cellostaticus]|nr:hypothetical protein Scel_03920 [Streptomyces cellostaticus]
MSAARVRQTGDLSCLVECEAAASASEGGEHGEAASQSLEEPVSRFSLGAGNRQGDQSRGVVVIVQRPALLGRVGEPGGEACLRGLLPERVTDPEPEGNHAVRGNRASDVLWPTTPPTG